MERFYTFSELQVMFGVSRQTIWRWHAERGLKVVRVGKVTRVAEHDLQEFLNRHAGHKPSNAVPGTVPTCQARAGDDH
jgi:excisionase family DNA binding protein